MPLGVEVQPEEAAKFGETEVMTIGSKYGRSKGLETEFAALNFLFPSDAFAPSFLTRFHIHTNHFRSLLVSTRDAVEVTI